MEELQERVLALGDIAILIEHYYKNSVYESNPSDSFNIAGFDVDKINTSFGWYFINLPKPTLEQLEAIKLLLEQ